MGVYTGRFSDSNHIAGQTGQLHVMPMRTTSPSSDTSAISVSLSHPPSLKLSITNLEIILVTNFSARGLSCNEGP